MAASSPLITLDGTKSAIAPARITPSTICSTPAISTASRKAWNEPSAAICAATTAVKPAAGPLTLVCDLLIAPTRMPPTIPDRIPENNGAFEAKATPRQSGRATRNTTSPADRSAIRDWRGGSVRSLWMPYDVFAR